MRDAGHTCRVLHVTHSLRVGGKERVLLDLARTGRAAGCDDRVLVFDHGPSGPELDLDPEGVPVELVKRGRGLDVAFALRLARAARRCGARVLHAHNDSAIVYGALACALLGRARPRLVATFHNLPSHASAPARRAARWACARADAVAAVSADLAERLRASRWADACRVVENGVDVRRFAPQGDALDLRRALGLAPETLLVGMLTRFDRGKRPADLARALERLGQADAPWVAVLAGLGPDRAACERAHASPRVRFLAGLADAPRFLRAVDAACLASDHEGSPLAVLEAMACARPVVASAVGGVPELLGAEPSMRGRLVAPGDAEAIACALRAWSDAAVRRALGAAARAFVVEQRSLERTYAAYARLYAPSRADAGVGAASPERGI